MYQSVGASGCICSEKTISNHDPVFKTVILVELIVITLTKLTEHPV